MRAYLPTTPGQRGMTTQDKSDLTTSKPLRSLIIIKRRGSGRNNQGRITVRHQGGGAKQFYRLVDFKLQPGISGVIEHIEYDPNRSARIARLKDQQGKYHYIIAASDMKVGHIIASGEDVPVDNGNRLPLKNIPVGSVIHAIEMQPNNGAQLVRSAGNSAQLLAKENNYAQVRLPSGEVRSININCNASLGVVSNEQHKNVKLGKAGRSRHMGIRPTVRGVVMNAVDHPHGGGDGGKHGVGGSVDYGSAPRTPWGQKTIGYKTRRRKSTTKYIIRSRHQARRI